MESQLDKPLLICFTYAGGTAGFYDRLKELLANKVEVEAFEYAGHGGRYREPLSDGIEAFTLDIMKHVEGVFGNNRDYSLFGYSMGSVAIVSLLKKLKETKNYNPPKHVYIASHDSMSRKELINLSEQEVKERTISYGAVPERLVNNRAFWRLHLPILKADYAVIGSMDFEKLCINDDIEVSILYSEEDVSLDNVNGWSKYFASTRYYKFPGGHFWIDDFWEEVASLICNDMIGECNVILG